MLSVMESQVVSGLSFGLLPGLLEPTWAKI